MIKNYSRLMYYAMLALLLAGCDMRSADTDQEAAREQQIEEMRAELRLVLKEVIELQKKVDTLADTDGSATAGDSGTNAAGAVVESIEMPAAERVKGNSEAKYAIIEFMDYQCPYCVRHAREVLPVITQRYIDSGEFKYGIRDYPLDFHSKAEGAAVAANCAAKLGKYWPMHESLIKHSKNLNDQLYLQFAEKHQMQKEAFRDCQKDPVIKNSVDDDLAYGEQLGIRGTPSFFIGKIDGNSIVDVIQLKGARSVGEFDRAIQKVMAAN
ncbi:DsbA family protein [Alcanivorax sp.]|uniref:DsbA family protein n=1 Tax=Alcanivorax sp. TaxID=1872427 RepID=UPI0025C265A1|nr:DsbA family protein [Alcanivorax sp.]